MALVSNIAKAPQIPGLAATVAAMLRDLTRDLSGSYRPERHYMRGPGPKWQEKHAVVVIVTRQAPLSHRLQAA